MFHRQFALAFVLAGLVLGVAGPAGAHVSVNPSEASKGGRQKVAFRIPSETEGVATVRVEIIIPSDPPIQSVRPRMVPGWRVTTEKTALPQPINANGRQITEVVSRVVWEGGRVEGGQFEEFELTLGPLPETDKVVFKAIQTMSNGEVANWTDEAVEGGPEPDRPAPVLTLVDAKEGEGHGHGTGGAAMTPKPIVDTDDGSAKGLSVIATLVAVAALALSAAAFVRRRPAAAR